MAQSSARNAPLAALLLLCLTLTACGGGGSSSTGATTDTTTAEAGSRPTATSPTTGQTRRARAGNTKSGAPGRQGKPGGSEGAQAFVQPGADNSIPEYGSEASRPERAKAAAALGAYLRAREEKDSLKACSLMGKTVRGQTRLLAEASGAKAETCVQAYSALSKLGSQQERASVLSGPVAAFRVKGKKGFALFYGPHRQQFMMPMVREAGDWKVSQSIPIAYPLGAPLRGG